MALRVCVSAIYKPTTSINTIGNEGRVRGETNGGDDVARDKLRRPGREDKRKKKERRNFLSK